MLYPLNQPSKMKEKLQNLRIDMRPFNRLCDEWRYNCSLQRLDTLQRALNKGIRFEQLVAYDSKLCREGRSPKERDAILTNLHPCMDCGDPVYVKPDPCIAGESGVNVYTSCQDCRTRIGRLLKKIKIVCRSTFRYPKT